ncbi:MAG TPA: hypothetical protein PKB09_03465 [Candidatus Saccharibacteria bacterium]|nr:hypothetical protein [Candidatus Saccharibacteria bacterium]
MEKFKSRRRVTKAMILTLGLALSACSSDFVADTGDTTARDMFTSFDVEVIRPGQSAFSGIATDSGEYSNIEEDIELSERQYAASWDDAGAPEIGQLPIRVDAHQAFNNEGKAGFSNDVACDSLPVDLEGLDPSDVYIGAVAFSNSDDDRVLISWPRSDGVPSDHILMCMDDGHEPTAGVLLVISDQQR